MKPTVLWSLVGAVFGAAVACTPALASLVTWWREGHSEMQWASFLTLTTMLAVPGALAGGVIAALTASHFERVRGRGR